jgi:hypothetical protein
MRGAGNVRFLELIVDSVETFGIRHTVEYYSRRMPQWEARFWLRLAVDNARWIGQ